jgi:hypothetical protein
MTYGSYTSFVIFKTINPTYNIVSNPSPYRRAAGIASRHQEKNQADD